MKDRKSASVTNLPVPVASRHSSSTPHLFVFQSSDDADSRLGSDPLQLPTGYNTHSDTRTSSHELESRLHPDLLCAPLRPASVYSSSDDTEPSQRPDQRSEYHSSVDLHPALSAARSYSPYSSLPPHSDADDAGVLVVGDADIAQVEAFFSGHNTQVVVCRALANMYLSSEASAWELKYTGIPAVLVDSHNTRSTGRPYIQLVLAEKGTGFMLWRDVVDSLSGYAAPDPSFHTVQLSSDRRQRAGFSYDDVEAARQFQVQLMALCSAHAPDTATSATSHSKKRRKKQRYLRPRKEDISQPCCFQHVTRVTLSDMERFYTLQSLVGPPGIRRLM